MNIKSSYKTLKVENSDGIVTLFINRPEKLNALNDVVLDELKSLMIDLTHIHEEQKIKGLIITGAGEKAFIAGADIAQMASMEKSDAESFALIGQEVSLLIENCPFPVIAAVNGYALGGGLEIALSADFILASANATLGLPEVKLGLIPGYGGTQRLARIVGRNRAKEMIYTGRSINAQEAFDLGLVLEVLDSPELLIQKAKSIIGTMSKNSPLSLSFAKRAINTAVDKTIEEGLRVECQLFGEVFKTEDATEGTNAFLQKRPPQFKGR